MKRIEDCRRRIHNYETFLVFCEGTQLSEVRESFIRINSQGTRIGAADRAFARASKFDMRGLVRDIQTRLNSGFDRIARTTILQTFALALDGKDVGERAIEAMIQKIEKDPKEKVRFDRMWPKVRQAFELAVDYIGELGVTNFGFLPSEPMLVTLALFFYYNGCVRPSAASKSRLKQWFWATAVGARYSGRGYRPNILSDAAFVQRLANNPKAHASVNVRVRINALLDTEYSRPGPLSNAFLCLLRSHRPRYLEDGSNIPLGEISNRGNRSDKHHIFPRALLSRFGIGPDKFNSIVNICYLVARENQSVGQKAPRNYFADVPRNERVRALGIRSHLIPSKDGRGYGILA
jgi:hypothetical protein